MATPITIGITVIFLYTSQNFNFFRFQFLWISVTPDLRFFCFNFSGFQFLQISISLDFNFSGDHFLHISVSSVSISPAFSSYMKFFTQFAVLGPHQLMHGSFSHSFQLWDPISSSNTYFADRGGEVKKGPRYADAIFEQTLNKTLHESKQFNQPNKSLGNSPARIPNFTKHRSGGKYLIPGMRAQGQTCHGITS